MRIVFVGASPLTLKTAAIAAERGAEVVIIDRDEKELDALASILDCGRLLGDGTRPAVLKQADPKGSDVLFCLTDDDPTNIIASLVGKSLGFARVVTQIEDEEFEHICLELGLVDTVVPARTVGRHLADLAEGRDLMELHAAIKGDARVFLFVAREEDAVAVRDLKLPEDARASHFYRDGELHFADPDVPLKKGDEVVVIVRSGGLDALRERWDSHNG
ncbi:MAG: TrkA family potassium uptake protein [Planctomycetes bacterium]|nr:TrkA family potassium uptake protein [Planctomycetota bacterium]